MLSSDVYLFTLSWYWRHIPDKSTVAGTQASAVEDVLSVIDSEHDPWDNTEPTRARILWVKNLTRLRHQVCFILFVFIIDLVTIDTSD